jgi:alkylhydroperoxidase family enzyme
MAWLPDVEDDAFAPDVATMAEAQVKGYGTVLNSLRQTAHTPAIATGASAMSRGLSRSNKTSTRLSHLLNLRVGAIVGCPFWSDLHAAGSSEDGISDNEISTVIDGSWRENPAFSDAERLALDYAERITATPPTVEETLVRQLQEHFSPAEIVEMAAICAWENYRARLNCALGVTGHGFYTPNGK